MTARSSTLRLSVPVPDPRRPSGVKHLPTLWGYALVTVGWSALAVLLVAAASMG